MIENEYRHGNTIVVCDYPGCDEVITLDGYWSDDSAAHTAIEEGWLVGAINTYCPRHLEAG